MTLTLPRRLRRGPSHRTGFPLNLLLRRLLIPTQLLLLTYRSIPIIPSSSGVNRRCPLYHPSVRSSILSLRGWLSIHLLLRRWLLRWLLILRWRRTLLLLVDVRLSLARLLRLTGLLRIRLSVSRDRRRNPIWWLALWW